MKPVKLFGLSILKLVDYGEQIIYKGFVDLKRK